VAIIFFVFIKRKRKRKKEMKSQSDTIPERIIQGKGKGHFNFNIHQIEIEEDGIARTVYAYDYVVIEGKLTKSKIIKALEDTKLDIDEEYDPANIETEYTEAKEALGLSDIASMTYAELDTYINNHVTTLAEVKAYLKKLSRVVLAILKYSNIK